MDFIRQDNGDLELLTGKNVVGRIFAPTKHSFDGRYTIRLRGVLDAGQEVWLSFNTRFPDEQSAILFVKRHWNRIRKYRLMNRSGVFL